jgi:hypothetical protein
MIQFIFVYKNNLFSNNQKNLRKNHGPTKFSITKLLIKLTALKAIKEYLSKECIELLLPSLLSNFLKYQYNFL